LLEDIPGERISNSLLDLVDNDESEAVRNNAVIVLLDRNEPVARSRLLEIVDDESFPVSIRSEIVGDLDNWEESEAIPVLGRLLRNSTEPALIEEAADALADIGSDEAVSVLLDGFSQQQDMGLRYVMLEEIANLETPRIMNFLSDIALENEDDELAAIAIDGIADREDNIGVAALEHIYLQSQNQQRRLAAMIGIGEAENAYAYDVISELIGNETNPELLAVAANALGRTGQEDAIDRLMSIYSASSDSNVHRSVIRALRRLERFPAATEAMLNILEDRLASAEAQ
jgi:HEAT repeat protein